MKRKVFLAALVSLFSCTILLAQTKLLKGRVVDENGVGLDHASVSFKEKSTGTKCDSVGNFTIKIPDDGKKHLLSVSYTGFNETKIDVSSSSDDITVKLVRAAAKEEEGVVVIGYQTIKKSSVIQTVSSLSIKDFKDIPLASAAEAITGKVSGVQVTTAEGAPGSATTIKLRGPGSITQDASPLYIVDGVEVEAALDKISPQDIQSIDILKDASATAIYGARGANGVFVITTKSGKNINGKSIVSYNGYVGFREITKSMNVMHPLDYAMFQYEKAFPNTLIPTNGIHDPSKLNLGYGAATDGSDMTSAYKALFPGSPVPDTTNNFSKLWTNLVDSFHEPNIAFNDWQKIVFGLSPLVQSHNISLMSGNKTTNYNLSFTNNSEGGIMINSGYSRNIVNFKLDHQISDKIKAGFNVRYNSQVIDGAGTSNDVNASFSRLRNSIRYKPYGPIDTYDPNYFLTTSANGLGLINPVMLAHGSYKKVSSNNLNLSGFVTYTINPIFTFKTTIGMDINTSQTNNFYDTITGESKRYGGGQPLASMQTTTVNTLNWSNVITFSGLGIKNSSFKKHHDINGMIGQEIYTYDTRLNGQESDYLPTGITPDKAFANFEQGTIRPITANYYTKRLASFFGRINYAFDKKYFATFTFRADGSSLFANADYTPDGSDRQWGYFPSLTTAWRVSSEPFMDKILKKLAITDLKIRATIGLAGNNRINPYLYTPYYSSGAYYANNGTIISGYNPLTQANSAVQWEQTTSRNLGVDASLFNGKLQLVVDAYMNTTDKLLVNVPQPASGYPGDGGLSQRIENKGQIQNTGIELQLSTTLVQKKDFRWTSNFNIAYNKNEIKSLGSSITSNGFPWNSNWGSQLNDYIVKVGESVGTMYGYVVEGDGIYHTYDYTDNSYTQLKAGVPNDQGILGLKYVPQPGMLKLKYFQANHNGTDKQDSITSVDRAVIGHSNPKFVGGWGNQMTYKNFDLSLFINFVFGNDILNANSVEFTNGYYSQANMLTTMNNRWRIVGDDGNLIRDAATLESYNAGHNIWRPVTSANFFIHNRNIEDGSFIRINNLTVGYTLANKALKAMHLTKLRIYTTVNNLAVITSYSGYDPEVNTQRKTPMTPGVDYSAYPRNRMYVFGVNVTF